jgi:hypothetical protein
VNNVVLKKAAMKENEGKLKATWKLPVPCSEAALTAVP